MKLNSLVPDAYYDLVHGKPMSIEKDNDGSYLFRYNIEPQIGIPDGATTEEQIGWQCREVRVWEMPTKQLIKKTIIRSVLDKSKEFSLVNGYNKHVLEIKVDEAAVAAYVEYLVFLEDLDALLIAEFAL